MSGQQENAPDVVGAVRGYRAFTITTTGMLASTAWAEVWQPGVNTAKCLQNKTHRHNPPPVMSCGCGFYAYWKAGRALIRGENEFPNNFGVVEAWGGVVVHEDGFRAQYAKIAALYVGSVGWRVIQLPGGAEILIDDRFRYVIPEGAKASINDEEIDLTAGHGRFTVKTADLIPGNYPGVAIYGNWTAMVSDYPPQPL